MLSNRKENVSDETRGEKDSKSVEQHGGDRPRRCERMLGARQAGGQTSMHLSLASPSSFLQDFCSCPICTWTSRQQFSPPSQVSPSCLILPIMTHTCCCFFHLQKPSLSCHTIPLFLFPVEIPDKSCLFLGLWFHNCWSLLNLAHSLWLLPTPLP